MRTALRSTSSAPARWRVWFATVPTYAGLAFVGVLLVVFFSIKDPVFLSEANITNVLRTSSIAFVLGMGVTLTVLTRGLDLSVGSLMALSGVLMVELDSVLPAPAAVVATIAAACLIGGIINGGLVGKVGLPPILVTLGTLASFRGIALVISDGDTTPLRSNEFVKWLGDGDVGPVPVPVLVMAAVFALCAILLRYTRLGRNMYAVGGNEEAARLCGVNPGRVRFWAYAISAATAGLGAVMLAGRLSSVSPTVGAGLELEVTAAVLLGGTSLAGGLGGVVGTGVAVLFLATLQNGLTLIGVSSFWQQVVTGGVLILAVTFDHVREGVLMRSGSNRSSESTSEPTGLASPYMPTVSNSYGD
jgi:ribose transport system permease protein